MKRLILSLLMAFICTLYICAQIRGKEISVMVTPDRDNWTYKTGETATFTIQVYKAQCLLKGAVIDYEQGEEMYPEVTKNNVTLKDGKLVLRGKLSKPGFYRVKVTAKVNGRNYDGMATVAYSPENIKPCAEMPSDFDAFWTNSLKEARNTPLEPTMVLLPERCTEKVNVYQVSFHNIRWGSRTYGILCVPKAEGKYPALLRVPGAGIRPYYGDVQTAEKGAITLEIGIHGIPVTYTQDYYDKLFKGALYNYWESNSDDRDAFYYKRVFVGAVRAVDFICSLPQFNGKQLGVSGSSQGGMLSFVTAALDSRVTFYAVVHPAMCDHTASLKKQPCGWPHYFYGKKADDKKVIVSRYYDGINFVRRIKVPGWFSFGYNDDVVAPTSMFAAYNTVSAPKEFKPYLQTGHYWYQEQYDEWNEWMWKQMDL
ncbi:MAG: acetylxylan esterase [Bacteroidaceae bacterium]|nr:acetylxylan esterase [Bacteroidaceae bacterium]